MAERRRRRVRTDPAPGSDPNPLGPASRSDAVERASEDDERSWGDAPQGNDEQLRRDKPPHY